MTANLTDRQYAQLATVAAGGTIHHMSRKKLVALGLLDEAGLTGLGSAALALDRVLGKVEPDPPAEAAPAKAKRAKTGKPRKSRSETPPANECGCGCGELCKGLWRPGHDARWAGAVARDAATCHDWAEVVEARAAAVGASEALTRKAMNMAERIANTPAA